MKLFLLLFLSACINSGQGLNSNSLDATKYVENDIDTTTPAGLRYSKAYTVLNDQCISCHSGEHDSWSQLEESDWEPFGYIIEGDASSSSLVTRLINYGDNMPLGGSALSQSDLDAVEDWINNL